MSILSTKNKQTSPPPHHHHFLHIKTEHAHTQKARHLAGKSNHLMGHMLHLVQGISIEK